MRVFLDACIDPRVVEAFIGNEVRTAFDLGLHRLKDHDFFHFYTGQFDVFVTIDRGLSLSTTSKRLPSVSSSFTSRSIRLNAIVRSFPI